MQRTFKNETTAAIGSKEEEISTGRQPRQNPGYLHTPGDLQSKRNSALSQEFRKKGFIDYRGQSVQTLEEASEIVSYFRNPHIEHLQMLFIKDKKIVAHHVISSGASNQVNVGKRCCYEIVQIGKRIGADSCYMAHNHPAGCPDPSKEDIYLTKAMGLKLQDAGIDLIGHIVTNHSKYALIDKTKHVSMHQFPIEKEKYNLDKFPVNSPDVAALRAKEFVKEGKICTMFLNNPLFLAGVEYVHPEKNIFESIRDGKEAHMSDRYIIVVDKRIPSEHITKLPEGMIDILVRDETGTIKSQIDDAPNFCVEDKKRKYNHFTVQDKEEKYSVDVTETTKPVRKRKGIRM